MNWLEVFGWVGSILVVWSLMQARLLRFRWMNFAGSVIATVYNTWVGIWPFAVMNGAIAIIDAYWITRLYREAHDAATFEVLEVGPTDPYLARLLTLHRDGIAATHPGFDSSLVEDPRGRSAWLVLRGDETVGVVVVWDDGTGTAVVELDWVSERYRDFTPGEFVHRDSGIFAAKGFSRIVVEDAEPNLYAYLRRVGFEPVVGSDQRRWERRVAVAA